MGRYGVMGRDGAVLTSMRAIIHEYRGAAHPCLQVIQGEGDVLGVVL